MATLYSHGNRILGGSEADLITQPESSPTTKSYVPGQALSYNSGIYIVTKAIAVGDSLVPGTNIMSTDVMAYLYNCEKKTIFKIAKANWSATAVNGLYEYVLQASQIYSPSPDIDVSGSDVGVAVTDDEQTAYGLLKSGTAYCETDDNTVHLFATAVPASDFYILVRGVA